MGEMIGTGDDLAARAYIDAKIAQVRGEILVRFATLEANTQAGRTQRWRRAVVLVTGLIWAVTLGTLIFAFLSLS